MIDGFFETKRLIDASFTTGTELMMINYRRLMFHDTYYLVTTLVTWLDGPFIS